MEFINPQNTSAPSAAATQTADKRIQLPNPHEQVTAHPHGDPVELEAKFAIEPIEPSRYVREKQSGVIHRYSDQFGERSDLIEPYTPSLAELLKFKERPSDLLAWGYTAEQLYGNGVSFEDLANALVPVEKLQELGASDEELIELGFIPKEVEPEPAPKAKSRAKPKPAATVTEATTPPPPPPAD